MNSGVVSRLRSLVAQEWGDISRYADRLGIPQSTLSTYLTGAARPPVDLLLKVAELEGVTSTWLLSGRSPKRKADAVPRELSRYLTEQGLDDEVQQTVAGYLEQLTTSQKGMPESGAALLRRIPILGKVPAGPPGSTQWVAYEAENLLEVLVDTSDPSLIALQVDGDSMFPTLFDGDHIIMSPEARVGSGDLVVAEIAHSGDRYQVKRLGKQAAEVVTLVSDNFLHFQPAEYPSADVQIRGRVIRVVRTPGRRTQTNHATMPMVEFYQSAPMQEALQLFTQLSAKGQQVAVEAIRAMVRGGI
jgi:phage repressor protein C with HTH and peptisase S24 domain